MATVAYHEAVPGHHFQIAIAQELDLPAMRRVIGFTGLSESWALNAERLARDMGLYDDDPYGNLGRLQFELLRAARLVTDTGIRSQRWTRESAKTYLNEAPPWRPVSSLLRQREPGAAPRLGSNLPVSVRRDRCRAAGRPGQVSTFSQHLGQPERHGEGSTGQRMVGRALRIDAGVVAAVVVLQLADRSPVMGRSRDTANASVRGQWTCHEASGAACGQDISAIHMLRADSGWAVGLNELSPHGDGARSLLEADEDRGGQ
jgi:hypothetical protein